MRKNNIEILVRTGENQYEELLCPKTSISNVINSFNTTLEEQLNSYLNVIEDTQVLSISYITIENNNTTIIPINNPNFIYLDSEMLVYYNGVMLINGLHYKILRTNKIELLEFTSNTDDEITFKVFNKFKANVDITYESLPKDQVEALDNLMESIRSYVADANSFKSTLINHLNSIDVNLSMENSYDEVAKAVYENLNKTNALSADFGVLFGSPYYGCDIEFNFGRLFGTESNVSYFDNDLGYIKVVS